MKNRVFNSITNIKKRFLITSSIAGIFILTGCVPTQYANDFSPKSSSGLEKYEGHYYCYQGKTSLVLSIDNNTEPIGAVFDFKVTDSIYGKFNMNGYYDNKNNKIYLFGKEWVIRPNNYFTVDLVGEFSQNKNLLSGRVIGTGCSTFELKKIN